MLLPPRKASPAIEQENVRHKQPTPEQLKQSKLLIEQAETQKWLNMQHAVPGGHLSSPWSAQLSQWYMQNWQQALQRHAGAGP